MSRGGIHLTRRMSFQKRVLDFFLINPSEELYVDDAAQKFHATWDHARAVLQDLARQGKLGKRHEQKGPLRWCVYFAAGQQ